MATNRAMTAPAHKAARTRSHGRVAPLVQCVPQVKSIGDGGAKIKNAHKGPVLQKQTQREPRYGAEWLR